MLSLYTDGGTIGHNPSPHGGSYAWCQVFDENLMLSAGSGIITPFHPDMDGKLISNNVTEFYAMLKGLESLSDGWEGKVCSDSLLTLARFFEIPSRNIHRKWPLKNIPKSWEERMHIVVERLSSNIEPILLSGHPTKTHFKAGVGARGTPVSQYNVWCDQECGRWIRKFKEENRL